MGSVLFHRRWALVRILVPQSELHRAGLHGLPALITLVLTGDGNRFPWVFVGTAGFWPAQSCFQMWWAGATAQQAVCTLRHHTDRIRLIHLRAEQLFWSH